nr:integrase, catalytic region, zinc finger, CCHC-type, peptidase aspartic, catalytic [Tanacetum cinerariifolium]
MRISLLYQGEYSQWVERFMNYLEEQTNGKAMINCIKNGDQPLPRVTQVSIAGTSSTEQPPLKDKSMWSDQEKKIQKIDRLARSLLIQGLLNDIYSLIDSNKTAKDLWDALARHILGFEYEWKQYATMMRQNKNLMDINIDALYNILKQNQGDVNDAMGLKKKTVVKLKKKDDEKKQDMRKVKCYNCKKEGHFKKDCKKVKVKDYEYYKTKMLLAKKDKDEQVLLAENQAWMESSSDSDQEINANMVFMAQIEKVLSDSEASSSSADDKIYEVSYYLSESEKIFHDCENFPENLIESQIDHNELVIGHNDSTGIYKLIRKFNKKIAKCLKLIEKANQQNKDFENQKKDLQDKYDVLKNQATTFEMNNKDLNEQLKVLIEKNDDLLAQTKVLKDQIQVKHVVIDTHVECQEKYAKLEAERYEYMIRYPAYFDNDNQHRKQIADQEVLYDKMNVQLVELDKHVRDLKNTVLEKDFKISELEECVHNKDLEIEKCLERFENPSYFEKAKDLRPSRYDENVIGLGYTPMFLTHSDEALEIKKFKRTRENKIEFAYDYGSLNASYVNEKIKFLDDYFQEIINLDFDKIESPFQQTSSLKPYVPTVILEKIIINLEDEVVSLLEKEKANLETIKSLKSKDVKRYSRKDLLSCNNSHLEETSSAYVCNDAMNVSCNSRLCDLFDENNLFIFDVKSVRISPVSKMPFRKKPHDSLNIVQICLWIIDSGCSKHMTGNRALLTNFVEKFLGTVRFGNNDFAVIAGYGDVVIGSMTIKKFTMSKAYDIIYLPLDNFVTRASMLPFESLHALFETKTV